MEKVNSHGEKILNGPETNTMVNGKKIRDKEKDYTNTQTVTATKANSKKVNRMERGNLHGQMAISIKETTWLTPETVMEYTSSKMAISTKETTNKIRSRDLESLFGVIKVG